MPEHPHPLALALADRMRARNAAAPRFALVLGGGSGRNIPPLLAARLHVDVLEEDAARAQALRDRFGAEQSLRIAQGRYAEPNAFAQRYDAALSTHALLHGSPSAINAALQALKDALAPDAEMMLTLGSASDPRYGTDQRVDEQTRMPVEGRETGVPHVYYDRKEAQKALNAFSILSLREARAREIVGSWAHEKKQTPDIVHWFAHIKMRSTPSSYPEDPASG